jgi:phosphoglycerate kinase
MLSRKLTIDRIGSLIKNQRVLLRVDFNVPIKNGIVKDDTRIRESLKTIQFALDNGARNIALISHLGRPNGQKTPKDSLRPVTETLSKLLNREVHFLNDCVGNEVIEVYRTINIDCQKWRRRKDFLA